MQEIGKLKRLPNIPSDLRRCYCVPDNVFAIRARQEHGNAGTRLLDFPNDNLARRTGNRHVQQNQIEVTAGRPKNINRGRTVCCLEHFEPPLSQQFHKCRAKEFFIFYHQQGVIPTNKCEVILFRNGMVSTQNLNGSTREGNYK